jgi:hypothetical protein
MECDTRIFQNPDRTLENVQSLAITGRGVFIGRPSLPADGVSLSRAGMAHPLQTGEFASCRNGLSLRARHQAKG